MKTAAGTGAAASIGHVRSPGFEVNDLGYQRNADTDTRSRLGYREFEPGKHLRSWA